MDSKKITTGDVKKISELSRLTISKEEQEELAGMFTDTLEYMNMLEELDTSEVQETYQVTGLTNVFQSGEIEESLEVEDAVVNASEVEDDLFKTEGVFDR